MPELLESTCDLKRVALIFNPVSGTEDPVARRTRLEALARDAGLSCELAETDRERGAEPLARKAAADGMERVLVSGGDGSITEAAHVLAGTPVALGVIPGGTGNLLAVNLGLPTDPQQAMRLALTGRAYPMDVGRANGRVFLIMAGMGVDAQMIRDADRESKKRLGPLAYFLAAWRHLGKPRALYTLTIDGRRIRRHAQTVLIANLGRVTAGVELIPGAHPESGQLQIAMLRARSFWDLLRLAAKALLGRIESDDLLEIHHGRRVRIETNRPQPVQIDGNEAGVTSRLEAHVEPGALRVVRPPELPSGPVLPSLPTPEDVSRNWGPALLALGAVSLLGYLAYRRRKRRDGTG